MACQSALGTRSVSCPGALKLSTGAGGGGGIDQCWPATTLSSVALIVGKSFEARHPGQCCATVGVIGGSVLAPRGKCPSANDKTNSVAASGQRDTGEALVDRLHQVLVLVRVVVRVERDVRLVAGGHLGEGERLAARLAHHPRRPELVEEAAPDPPAPPPNTWVATAHIVATYGVYT